MLYSVWAGMRARCNNAKRPDFKHYGGRGIRCCNEWTEYLVFKAWALDNGYRHGLTLDRIEVNGDYRPDNCRFVDSITQAQNRRVKSTNKTGVTGVYKQGKSYIAHISVKRKQLYLGSFASFESAIEARRNAEIQYQYTKK